MLIPAGLIRRPLPKSRELRSLHIWRQKNTLDCQVFEVTWLRTPVRDVWKVAQTTFVFTSGVRRGGGGGWVVQPPSKFRSFTKSNRIANWAENV
jgi:hypothetical protein